MYLRGDVYLMGAGSFYYPCGVVISGVPPELKASGRTISAITAFAASLFPRNFFPKK